MVTQLLQVVTQDDGIGGELLPGLAGTGAGRDRGLVARVRNLMMPLFSGRFYEKATAWLYACDPGTLTGMGSGAGVVT